MPVFIHRLIRARCVVFCWTLLKVPAALAQTDTLFWFAAPEASAGLGEVPVSLHLSAGPAGAQITVDQPANPVGFAPINLTVAPNSVLVHDLTARAR